METNGHASHIGFNGVPKMHARRLRSRPPTVDEALPYSPFSSAVPFNSDLIPIPTIGLRSSVSLFSNARERDEARLGLESLNREAADSSRTSQRLQQTLQDLKLLLDPESISTYKFKIGPKLRSDHNSTQLPEMSLSPFTQLLYDATSPDFTYPSPETPTPPKSQKKVPSQTPKPSSKQAPPQISVNNAHFKENSVIKVELPKTHPAIEPYTPSQSISNPRSNSSIAVVVPAHSPADHSLGKAPIRKSGSATPTPTPSKIHKASIVPPQHEPVQRPIHLASQAPEILHTPANQAGGQRGLNSTPSGSNGNLEVVIPNLPARFSREEYGVFVNSPTPDTPTHLSRKRKRSNSEGSEGDLRMTYDQRQKSELAYRNFGGFLRDIFEADDQLQQENSSSNNFFTSTSEGYGLNTATQSKAESLLQKVIELGCFSQAPLEDLLRLQKLCENGIRDSETVDLQVDEQMGESEVLNLVQNMGIAELGLKSARTSLRLMAGGREDKQLYSEDAIQSALNAFTNVMDTCLIPIVELRSTGPSSSLFKLLSAEKKVFANLFTFCRRLLSLLAAIVAKTELSETIINKLEFSASKLIFVENAHSEKDSIVGVAKFDSLRVVAMEILSQIFLNNPLQRQGIFDEILTSLEKLPVTKQSARQFKLADGGSIQLVSALIMRLIQTSASKADNSKETRRAKALEALNRDNEEVGEQNGDGSAANGAYTIKTEERAEKQVVTAIQELSSEASPLLKTARDNAVYVVSYIVNRALKSTKTGDTPYRNLLDLFVEDFITCLNSVDWPSAELLLRLLLFKMVHLVEGDKTAAPAKNMAIDLLGSMGAAISELISHARKTAATLEDDGSELGKYLARLAESSLEKSAASIDVVAWACGPFRVSLEFLNKRCLLDPQLTSAIGYLMAEWATKITSTYDTLDEKEDAETMEREYGRLAYRLRMMIADKRWLSTEYTFDSIAESHARLAYSLTVINSQFCESFGRVLTILLGSMTSEQATVRSKSMKSILQVLETDPSILDREWDAVKKLLLRCSNDTSVLVRDSTLGLIGKCISLRPRLEAEMIPNILQRVNDAGIGVRKRAMKLSKDIYLRNTDGAVRSSIADALLQRVTDQDEGVQDLARQSIEEVWMSPFYQSPSSTGASSAQFQLAMADQVALMVKTVQRGKGVAAVLDKVLQNMLSNDSKFNAANFKVCHSLVAAMFETIIDNSSNKGNDALSGRDALQVLTIFAKSNAKLFTPEQVKLLQPYIANVATNDDLAIYRSVVVIFRHVIPHLSNVHQNFLESVQKDLRPQVTKMSKLILDDIIACLWTISKVLDNYSLLTRIAEQTLGVLKGLKNAKLNDSSKTDDVRKVNKLLLISGVIGKHCDLESQIDFFKGKFPNADSVSRLMSDTFAPYASPEQPLEVRKSAFDAIGMVCQSWPKNFNNANIVCLIKEVFAEQNDVLEVIIMKAFKEYLLLEEKRSEAGSEDGVGVAAEGTAKLGVMGGGQGDGIAIGIAQQFLAEFTRIALASQDDQALLATEIIASITRQGLVHPKECGSTLIALETSQNPKIVELAFRGHRTLHEKHETMLEREYMRAVHLAYIYQRDVVKDIHGATLDPFVPKLHMMIDVLKISKPKNRKKFFETLCERIDFDPIKMSLDKLPEHLEFAQFIVENMAFFEYGSVDELLTAISAMEKVVAGTGTSIAHMIETEIFHVSLEQPMQVDENGNSQPIVPKVDEQRLLQLTASSMMLSCLWEARTYLRRQYGLTTNRREGKGKPATKDLNKAPTKVPFINGDKFWESVSNAMSAFESEESKINQCRSFVDMLNVDPDFKLATENDETGGRLSTPSEDEDNATPGPPGSGRGRKRKGSTTPGGRKKRARSSSIPRGRGKPKWNGKKGSADMDDEDDF